jgi:CheY-like chemotaxis protein
MDGTAPRSADPGKAHILVVEDDATLGQALCKVLTHAGYSVVYARDFRSALEALEGNQPLDLLLVDIVMPDSVNGLALARMARLRRRNLKVVYVSGYSIPGVEDELLGPILRKPIDDHLLIEEIEKVLAA